MREKLQKIQAALKVVTQQVEELLDAERQDKPQLSIPNIVSQADKPTEQPSNVKNGVIQLGMPPASVMEKMQSSQDGDEEEEEVDDLDEEFGSYDDDSEGDDDEEGDDGGDDDVQSAATIKDLLAELGNDRTRQIGHRIVKHLSDGKEATQQDLADFLQNEVESKVKAVARDMADKKLLVTVSHKPKTYKLPKSFNLHS